MDYNYLIIRVSNVHSRSADVYDIEMWARTNSQTPNRAKSKEMVFMYTTAVAIWKCTCYVFQDPGRRRDQRNVCDRPCSWHHHQLSALSALTVLRSHGMCDSVPSNHPPGLVIGKPLYASSAWWGFIHRIDGFLRRSVRCGYWRPLNPPPLEEQCTTEDRKLFNQIHSNTLRSSPAPCPPYSCLIKPQNATSISQETVTLTHQWSLHWTPRGLRTFTKLKFIFTSWNCRPTKLSLHVYPILTFKLRYTCLLCYRSYIECAVCYILIVWPIGHVSHHVIPWLTLNHLSLIFKHLCFLKR